MKHLATAHILLLLTIFILGSSSVAAQNNHVLGYCPEELTNTESVGFEEAGKISAAIRIPSVTMMRYKGGKITRIRIAVKDGFEKPSVWIRTSLTASSVVTQSIKELNNGWNEVELNKSFTITGEELYIGYTATQPSGFKGIMTSGHGNENTSLIAYENNWNDYHNEIGILFIQAIVEAEIPANDLGVINGTIDKDYYQPSESLKINATVENLGTQSVDAYRVSWLIDGEAQGDGTSITERLEPIQTKTFSNKFGLSDLTEGKHYAQMVVKAVDIFDEKSDNDTLSIPFYVYTSSFPRTVLLEHFTSLPCINCPEGDRLLEEIVPNRQDVAWVSHHVGYKEDEFTLTESRPYVNFGVLGNPYIILDRTTFDGDTPAFIFNNKSTTELNMYFDIAAQQPSFVQLKAELTASGKDLSITIDGEAKDFFQPLYPRATLNVFLVEDHVKAIGSQAGDVDKKYHDNIVRAILTRQTGNLISWSDETTFNFTTTTTADDSWDISQLRVVTFVTAATDRSTNYPTGEVLNTTQSRISNLSGIVLQEMVTDNTQTIYNMEGQLVGNNQLNPGLYIIKKGNDIKKAIIR